MLTAIIEPDGQLNLVSKCPLTAAEREAMDAQRVADEEAAGLARVVAVLAKERHRKAAKRRAEGKPTRAEWLAKHSQKPWIPLNMSKSTYYRIRRRDGSGGPGAEIAPPVPRPLWLPLINAAQNATPEAHYFRFSHNHQNPRRKHSCHTRKTSRVAINLGYLAE